MKSLEIMRPVRPVKDAAWFGLPASRQAELIQKAFLQSYRRHCSKFMLP